MGCRSPASNYRQSRNCKAGFLGIFWLDVRAARLWTVLWDSPCLNPFLSHPMRWPDVVDSVKEDPFSRLLGA